mgnify:CR=1 FL=1
MRALVTGITVQMFLVAMQQLVHLAHIRLVCRRGDDRVCKTGVRVRADVYLHPEVVSRPRDLPSQSLAEPYVTVSRHTALVVLVLALAGVTQVQ